MLHMWNRIRGESDEKMVKYLPLTMFSHQIWRSALNFEKGKGKESKGDIHKQYIQSDSHLNGW